MATKVRILGIRAENPRAPEPSVVVVSYLHDRKGEPVTTENITVEEALLLAEQLLVAARNVAKANAPKHDRSIEVGGATWERKA